MIAIFILLNIIIKEIKLAIQEIGRSLGIYVHKKKRVQAEGQKRDYITKYMPHIAEALGEILGAGNVNKEKVEKMLAEILEKHRGELEKVEMENTEYDEDFAKIGKDNKNEEKEAEE